MALLGTRRDPDTAEHGEQLTGSPRGTREHLGERERDVTNIEDRTLEVLKMTAGAEEHSLDTNSWEYRERKKGGPREAQGLSGQREKAKLEKRNTVKELRNNKGTRN